MTAALTDDRFLERFRATMAGVCGPVTVVTSAGGGQPHGTTVSAFTSLSMDPPLILVCLDRKSELLTRIRVTQMFGVNILAEDQASLAITFSGKGFDRFRDTSWSHDGDLPRLDGAAGWVRCRVSHCVGGGDHVIVVGRVLGAEVSDRTPLTYGRRTFGTHVASDHQSGL